MVRIMIKGKPFTNAYKPAGEFRKIYTDKKGKEYILHKNKRRYLK